MTGTIRILIVSSQPELVTNVKRGIQDKPGIEMIININKPTEAMNKMGRQALNLLLIDLDTTPWDDLRTISMAGQYQVVSLYTSTTHSVLAKQLGGSNFVLKPSIFTSATAAQYTTLLYQKVSGFYKQNAQPGYRDMARLVDEYKTIIAVASSTGGTEALEKIIRVLPPSVPPLVAVQHMPSGFTRMFAERLNAMHKLDIKEADTGDFLMTGQLLLAPADRHMKLVRQKGKLAVECFSGAKMHGVMPAADVLFESVANLSKSKAIGVILTGMGADGAKGLMMMHNLGARTIGQDKSTCVVYGMPKVAKDLGAVDFELPLEKIAEKILAMV
jgi:two-component system chemotaxis response regulator CheB